MSSNILKLGIPKGSLEEATAYRPAAIRNPQRIAAKIRGLFFQKKEFLRKSYEIPGILRNSLGIHMIS